MKRLEIKVRNLRSKGPVAVLVLLGLFCLGVGQANADTKYVDINTGSDGNTGTQASPFKTITHALKSVAKGDTILVAAGTYSASNGETFPIELPQIFYFDISLIGDSPTNTIIDAGGVAGKNCIQDNYGATNFSITGFTIKGAKRYEMGGYGIHFSSGSHTIRNNIIIDNTNGIYLAGNGTIANNSIDSNDTDGIACNNMPNVTIKNNIITNNGNYGVADYYHGSVTIDYNDVWNNTNGNYGAGADTGTHDISADPLFVDAADSDYHLKSCSPCTDKGDTSPYDNEPEPNGDRINMGAYGNTLEAANNPEASAEADEPICLNETLQLYGYVVGG
ncbi:DUF1565 domain-containing protein, partial [bacterium]|nr:DUF1565 domain-containing protein [bacterium]